MTAFVLIRGPNRIEIAQTIQAHLTALGVPLELLGDDGPEALFFAKGSNDPCTAHLKTQYGDILRTGMFCYRGKTSRSGLQAFYRDFDPVKPTLDDTLGQFCIVLRKNDQTALLCDALGVCKIYHNDDYTILSNLFIAVVAGISSPEINIQGAYEYAWNGVSFGRKSFLRNVHSLPVGKVTVFAKDKPVEFRDLPALDLREDAARTGSVDDLVEVHLDRLRALIRSYLGSFGDRINLSLSGGYDSRLLLALLLDAGVKPRLFTYGKETDRDCQIARQIAESEGLAFEWIDKSQQPPIPVDTYAAHVEASYGVFDGWKVTGLFDSGADAPDRAARVRDGWIKVNGSLGEIYRNFFYLPDRTYSARDVVWSFFARYAPEWCTSLFDAEAYESSLAEEITEALGITSGRLTRSEVELVYPLVRGRYWTAREVPINQSFGPCFFPFLEPAVIKDTCDIPIALKNYGFFEGHLVRRLNPSIAACPSIYGHSLAVDPPRFYRLRAQLTYRRPPFLRRRSYRLQHMGEKPRPYYLQDPYLAATINPQFPHMRHLFRVESVRDSEVLNRIATMEYTCQRLTSHQPPTAGLL